MQLLSLLHTSENERLEQIPVLRNVGFSNDTEHSDPDVWWSITHNDTDNEKSSRRNATLLPVTQSGECEADQAC